MPRPSKGIRLWLRPEETDRQGRTVRHAQWVIRDGRRTIATGCGASARGQADLKLAAYIESRYVAPKSLRPLDAIPVADVIAIYLQDKAPGTARPKEVAKRAKRLLAFFGGDTLAAINGARCRAYVAHRGNAGGARRDLQDLSAAIGHHHAEGYHREVVIVPLPPAGGRRERHLTRSEIARLVWAAWRMREQMRRSHSDLDAPKQATAKRTGQHIARAILLAYYTGSRIGDVLRASWCIGPDVSYLNLDAKLFHRLPPGKRETNKRQPTTRLPDRIVTHLRRWRDGKQCATHPVEWQGKPVGSIKTGFWRAVALAGLGDDVNRHTLRHSRITHLKQAGIPSWEVAGFVGASEEMIDRVYGHHDPRSQARVANAR